MCIRDSFYIILNLFLVVLNQVELHHVFLVVFQIVRIQKILFLILAHGKQIQRFELFLVIIRLLRGFLRLTSRRFFLSLEAFLFLQNPQLFLAQVLLEAEDVYKRQATG